MRLRCHAHLNTAPWSASFALALALALAFGSAFAQTARADLLIHVDKSAQRMSVSRDGEPLYVWPVSTGIARYDTPSGAFKPFRMEKDHFSREWDDAPMPYSIFFTQRGHAIHGTNHKSLGRPASHGCVRLSVANAATLWALVRQEKMANTRVVLSGAIPGAPVVARRDRDDAQDFYDRDSDDDIIVTAPRRRQRTARGWREYNDGPRYFYYRERPYYPPPPRYRYVTPEPYPFPFRLGR